MSNQVLSLNNIVRSYEQGGRVLTVLNHLNLIIREGEIVALVGPSGSGKTTLLQIAGLLDSANNGEVVIGQEVMNGAGDLVRTQARNKYIGFIYQFHHLMPEFSALENVMMPQLIAGVRKKEAKARAMALLGELGLSDRLHHRPAALSGGEQQRVAAARALANNPSLLLADEPTGNLDPHTAEDVFRVMLKTIREQKIGALIVTHNSDLARRMSRILELKDGLVRALSA